jgi:hypothetical protein
LFGAGHAWPSESITTVVEISVELGGDSLFDLCERFVVRLYLYDLLHVSAGAIKTAVDILAIYMK